MKNQIIDILDIHDFMNAGNAIFTIVSKKSACRFTYKLEHRGNNFYLKVLTGPTRWSAAGMIDKNGQYRHWSKSILSDKSVSVKAFLWVYNRAKHRIPSPEIEFYHSGNCAKCGCRLTTPDSLRKGLGPKCAADRQFKLAL